MIQQQWTYKPFDEAMAKTIADEFNLPKIIAKVMTESSDHPDVDELYNRVSKIDSKISIAVSYTHLTLPTNREV